MGIFGAQAECFQRQNMTHLCTFKQAMCGTMKIGQPGRKKAHKGSGSLIPCGDRAMRLYEGKSAFVVVVR
jgi:hypothetical protein